MKNTFTKIITFMMAATLIFGAATCPTLAESPKAISPALMILARDVQMVKSGLLYSDITFTPLDFERALNVGKIRSVTVTALPNVSEGTLKLGERPVTEGETVTRKDISSLKFVPASADVRESSFSFSTDLGAHTLRCTLYVLEKMNFAPTTALTLDSDLYIETSKGISFFGVLGAVDPENDSLTYRIVKQPSHGTVSLSNKQTGDYRYTPDPDYTGKDSFSYTVSDRYGNYSDITTVTVRVNKMSSLVFADMSDHWAATDAVKAAEAGIIEGRCIGAQNYFHPDEEVNRADFLVMLMKAAKIKPQTEYSATIFTDDKDIPDYAKGYVTEALSRGYVHGSYTSSGIYFMPNEKVTRAEAAVMINNILDAKVPVILPVFADIDAVPSWAKGAFYSLSALGIFNGTGAGNISPNSTITRAQAAKILNSVYEMQ